MAGNTPLKRYKQNTHGGGIRDPLIVHWPAGIPQGGEIRHQFHHVCDITPTVLEVTGVQAPAEIHGVTQQPIEGTSFAYSFGGGAEPTRKRTQYFEMLGHRGLWHEGWKAVTWHKPGTDFDADQWELYHLDSDFNEMHDLAEQEPARLKAMIARWFSEAGACNVLPLDDTLNRFVSSNPHSVASRRHWVLQPGGGRIPQAAAPDIRNRSYRITAHVDIPEGGAEGVLIAQGDWCGGYALYLKDGHLFHDYNFVNRHYVARSTLPVPTGRHTLSWVVRKTGDYTAEGELLIDDEPCGSVVLPQTYRAQASFIGMEVGRAPKPAVSDFEAPFPFTGVLHRVEVDLGDDQQTDPQASLEAALRRQ
jgi:arylsulfatase